MKNLIVSLLIIIAGILACSQTPKKIPVTTNSKTALNLYNEAIDARADVYLTKFKKLSDSAIKEDPDFFMANYQVAMGSRYFNNLQRFKEYGEKALNSKTKLSKAELILKDALQKLLENPNADVTDLGRKIIELYPEDVNAYYIQVSYQVIIKDTTGFESTLKKALEVTDNPAPFYNMLGYVYMAQRKYDDAATVLDKYIELRPNIPNSWDSKGDYFMKIRDYENAYKSFMKAHEIDTLWDRVKIKYVKKILDSLAVK